MPPPPITVRPIEKTDTDAVVKLLQMRDELDHPADAVSDYLFNLDPPWLTGWLAWAGDEPAGLNTLYLRQVNMGGETKRAGYWAHLFVAPEYRRTMAYTQLVFSMIKAAPAAGLDLIYTGTRRGPVAAMHQKMGFVEVGTLGVLFKPLRPGELLARHKDWGGGTEAQIWPLDAVYRAYLACRRPSRPTGLKVQPAAEAGTRGDAAVALLNTAGDGRITKVWSTDYFRRRFARSIEGWPYTLLTAGEGDAALVYRVAVRGRGIRAGVVMDVVHQPGRQAAKAAAGLIAEAERLAIADRCHTMLYLNGASDAASKMLRTAGYRAAPETYHLLIWPKNLAANAPGNVPGNAPGCVSAGDVTNWRFTFADHDAF